MALQFRRLATEISEWQLRLLVRAGFDRTAALELAHDPRIDLHQLLELVDRGCPPDLAARIVAPLDSSPDA